MSQFSEAFHQLDYCLARRMDAFRTPALVMALTDRTRSIRVSANGFASLESREQARADHLFAIGSIGKSFTALAILQAHEAGLLELRAPVTRYLPWFKVCSDYEPITIHHLLTHSSGLPRGTDFSPDPRAEVYGLRTLNVGFSPGKHFWYSDLGYKVLGLVLESIYRLPYAEVIRSQILAPLEMNET
jgi:CubicO group peptidase (beta-lactamase class C family)